jgi:hypothetical protein
VSVATPVAVRINPNKVTAVIIGYRRPASAVTVPPWQ